MQDKFSTNAYSCCIYEYIRILLLCNIQQFKWLIVIYVDPTRKRGHVMRRVPLSLLQT